MHQQVATSTTTVNKITPRAPFTKVVHKYWNYGHQFHQGHPSTTDLPGVKKPKNLQQNHSSRTHKARRSNIYFVLSEITENTKQKSGLYSLIHKTLRMHLVSLNPHHLYEQGQEGSLTYQRSLSYRHQTTCIPMSGGLYSYSLRDDSLVYTKIFNHANLLQHVKIKCSR